MNAKGYLEAVLARAGWVAIIAIHKRRRLVKALARELEAVLRDEQGLQQPRAHWRYPYGIGAHAIALCALAAAAALGYWLTH